MKLDAILVETLENADQLELLSLGEQGKLERKLTRRPAWPVLGKVTVSDPATRRKALDALYQSLDEGGSMAWCFDPHHVLRAARAERTVELVICFKCFNMKVWQDGNELAVFYPVNRSAKRLFNEILDQAGVAVDEEAR